jgi:lipopolysaccharide transport system ATP-binding protein
MAIIVDTLGKAYPHRVGPWRTLAQWLGLSSPRQHWVFRGISFSISQGESVGIIGINGAGKSTLLKILTGTAIATEGSAKVYGQVAALLELGMGFHPEFSGRQNVFLAGKMMGMSRLQVEALLPQIEAFAEIGTFFDEPVRTYSSGMFVRLAFSVATAVRPDILIVDEALSVGDLYFQHKSFARIRSFHEQGSTLLFVSHDPAAVKSLCSRAILLGNGQVLADGSPDDVLELYNALIAERETQALAEPAIEEFDGRSGNGRARVLSVRLETTQGPVQTLRVGEPASLCIEYQANEFLPDLVAGILIKDRTGYDVYGTNTHAAIALAPLGDQPGQRRLLRYQIPAMNLGVGSYSVTVALHSHAEHLQDNYDWWERALVFQVASSHRQTRFVGVASLDARPELSELNG